MRIPIPVTAVVLLFSIASFLLASKSPSLSDLTRMEEGLAFSSPSSHGVHSGSLLPFLNDFYLSICALSPEGKAYILGIIGAFGISVFVDLVSGILFLLAQALVVIGWLCMSSYQESLHQA